MMMDDGERVSVVAGEGKADHVRLSAAQHAQFRVDRMLLLLGES